MSVTQYSKTGYRGIKVVGANEVADPTAETITYEWTQDGSAEIHFKPEAGEAAPEAQPHGTMKSGSKIVVNTSTGVVYVKEVT